MHFPLRLSLAGLSVLTALVLAGSAAAHHAARQPEQRATITELRSLADHYRTLTWTYERAARAKRTKTSFSYRRSRDRGYLGWTVDLWTRRAYTARSHALKRIHRRLSVKLPAGPGLRAALYRRIVFNRSLTLKLHRIYPGKATSRFAHAHARTARATLRLWQRRGAAAALAVARHATARQLAAVTKPDIPAELQQAFLCIHHYEGSWTANTGNGYYGGPPDGLPLPVPLRRLLHEPVGDGGEVAPVGPARGCRAGLSLRARLRTVAEHGPHVRTHVASRSSRGCTSPITG